MLKGTTTIELTDILSGKKQVIKKHNMITNALGRLYQPTLGHLTNESTLRSYVPAHTTLLGGLLLFDAAIPANAEQIYAPAGPALTGCARYNTVNTGTGLVLGSYNTTESEYNETGKKMKFVYDFNTSQGNGTIASICLTSIEAGYGTYNSDMTYSTSVMKSCFTTPKWLTIGGKDMYAGISTGAYYHLFTIDPDLDICYYFTLTNATTISIQQRQAGLKNFSLFSNSLPIISTSADITLGTVIGSYRCWQFDRDDNALYIISADSSTIAANGTFVVTKIAFGSWAVTQYTMTNTTNTTLYSGSRFAIVHRGNVYLRSNASRYSAYKLELGNSANVSALSGTAANSIVPVFAVGGRVYWQYTSYSSGLYSRLYVSDEATNRLNFSGNSQLQYVYQSYNSYYTPSYVPVLNHEMLYYITCGSISNLGFHYLADYLATINNLTEPVVKTADKTMKITYTIEEQ